MENILNGLNDQQKEAVVTTNGPIFVVAGAGTGKTKALTTRVAYLIEKGVSPKNILAITFTNKAAKEMKERISLLRQKTSTYPWALTFHSFGLKILKMHIDVLDNGRNIAFSIFDDEDSLKLVKEAIKELNLDQAHFQPKFTLELISKYKNKETVLENEYHKIYLKYQNKLQENNALDFDDLLIYTLEILETNEVIRDNYQDQFKYILVDEFQDTNSVQYKIVKILAQKNKNIFVVGDPDQSIYSFRGANYQNNLDFIHEFNPKIIILDQNYRSPNNILEAANRLIENNKNRVDSKKLKSDLGPGKEIIYKTFFKDIYEAYFVSSEIENLQKEGYKNHDIAILYRSHSLSRIFEETFIRTGKPYTIYGGTSFYERKEIKDILAYIKVALDNNKTHYIKRIINEPKRKIGHTTIDKILDKMETLGVSFFDAVLFADLKPQTKTAIDNFKEIIKQIEQKLEEIESIKTLIDFILDVSGYAEMLKQDGDDGLNRLENIKELKTVFAKGEDNYEGSSKDKLKAILDEIALFSEHDNDESEADKVILSTYHQVKGLEFKVVFMVALEEGIFPNALADLEEERRICYVGITRAKERLYITNAEERFRFGSHVSPDKSKFIFETLPKTDNKITKDNHQKSSLLVTGDKVVHKEFGDGVVVSINDGIAKIAFEHPYGVLSIKEDHPTLRKVNK